MNSKVAAIIQARTTSTRLPNKVLAKIGEVPLIEFLISRVKKCCDIDHIILATTTNESDNLLVESAYKLGIDVIRGEENDVLSRFIRAAKKTECNILIRLTGDCPLLDPHLISKTIKEFKNQEVGYLSNCYPPSFPDGLDIEIFYKNVLFIAHEKCKSIEQREHVTPWIRESGLFSIGVLKNKEDLSKYRWTVDEFEDLDVIRSIMSEFEYDENVKWESILDLYKKKPEIFKVNSMFKRNEGSNLTKGQKLWRRAKKVIPGGNMLLSKRPEMFLPEKWPAYFSKAKGCYVWDLEGRKFTDMSIMGIGTNILGYGHKEVDNAVKDVIIKGNMSTLNCPEEVLLAEKLIEMHPWASKARFARSGGEANAIAIRIARAFTGKEKIAICGYHGWHDWYLATNLKDSSALNNHLLPGLDAAGVPSGLKGTVKPFNMNDLDNFKKIAYENDLAAVKMEVERSMPPNNGFLESIREICNKLGIILIFDECTSGFRETFGGIHLKYDVYPDLAMFGKALGNGYAITAIIGKDEVMDAAQKTFISSTFWTERIGPAAALKTLEVMEREKTWITITKKGNNLKKIWQQYADLHNIKIEHNGLPSLAGFTFKSKNALKYKTYFTQEMLKEGFLASTSCYSSIAHTDDDLEKYKRILNKIFQQISKFEEQNVSNGYLEGPVCHNGFKRLN